MSASLLQICISENLMVEKWTFFNTVAFSLISEGLKLYAAWWSVIKKKGGDCGEGFADWDAVLFSCHQMEIVISSVPLMAMP